MPEFEPTVQCINCGYVSLIRRTTRELSEVEASIRTSGVIPEEWIPKDPNQKFYEPQPICFRQRHELQAEYRSLTGGTQAERFLAVVSKGRPCGRFKTWEQGLSPKEHLAMDFIERQEERLQLWAKESSKSRAEQAQSNQDFNTKNLAVLKQIQRATITGPVLGAIFGAVIGTLLGVVSVKYITTPSTAPPLQQTSPQTSKAGS